MFRVPLFVDDEEARAGREDLERFEELDKGVALIRRQSVEGLPLEKSFSVVTFHSFAGCGELAVMKESAALVVETPELTREKFAVSGKEGG